MLNELKRRRRRRWRSRMTLFHLQSKVTQSKPAPDSRTYEIERVISFAFIADMRRNGSLGC